MSAEEEKKENNPQENTIQMKIQKVILIPKIIAIIFQKKNY